MIDTIFRLLIGFRPVVPIFSISGTIAIGIVICIVANIIENLAEALFLRLKRYSKAIFILSLIYIGIIFYAYTPLAQFFGAALGLDVSMVDALSIFSEPYLLASIIIIYFIAWFIMGLALTTFVKLSKEDWIRTIRSIVVGPLGEELVYRYLMLGIMVLAGINIINAIIFQALLFACAPNHLLQKNNGLWTGYYRPALAFSSAIVWGFCAIVFGIVFTWAMHALGNLIGTLAARAGLFKLQQ